MTRHLGIIDRAALKDWKASAWFLEMNDREHYGKKVQADVNANLITMEQLLDEIED